MTSEELNDAHSAKLGEIIHFFVRERESKIHYIKFGKENSASIYAQFLTIIAILIAIANVMGSGGTASSVGMGLLVASMFVVNYTNYRVDKNRNGEYENATHKFDVIIGDLQTSKISDKIVETSKLIKLMEERPKEIIDKNNLYEDWLEEVFNHVKNIGKECKHSEMHVENSG